MHRSTVLRSLHSSASWLTGRPGADYFTKRNPERAMRRMVKEANSLGLTLRFEPISARSDLTHSELFVSVASAMVRGRGRY